MPVPEESLFSLELVIDKLYIPHVTCRFPAVAFRLLDFPTILINHVEDGLSKTIKEKIARDPYYQMPDQFAELQDNHGNYMVKKGKSCLFTTSVDSLKAHLLNTPLYVMVLDMYPETPKLVGNSSVPLDNLMKDICVDIVKNGASVPSVHGDKGLFKIYSLMGKEIGYIVLGFRLLCLGPSLAGHVSSKPILKSKLHTAEIEDQRNVNFIDVKPVDKDEKASPFKNDSQPKDISSHENKLRSSHDMGSMTDAMKHDVLLQTIPTEEKAVHVVISEPERPKPKHFSSSTQTHKRNKRRNRHFPLQGLDIKPDLENQEDDLEVPNVICPPPLFYNKYSEPRLRTERPVDYTDDESLDDISEIGSINGHKTPNEVSHVAKSSEKKHVTLSNQVKSRSAVNHCGPRVKQQGPELHLLQNNQTEAVFPILTALLNELVGIQGSHGLENVISKVNTAIQSPKQPDNIRKVKNEYPISSSFSKSTVSSERKMNLQKEVPIKSPRNKSWIRKTPESIPRKGKLTYRLTKTQKLRLAKGNPKWLKEKEKTEESLKTQKPLHAVPEQEDELNVTNFSDTLTEVRRLAEKELANQTLDSVHDMSTMASNLSSPPRLKKKYTSKTKSKESSSPKVKHKESLSNSNNRLGKSNSNKDVKSPTSKLHSKDMPITPKSTRGSPAVMEHDDAPQPLVAVEPELRRFVSPDVPSTTSGVTDEDNERVGSVMNQKSVKVHIPKADTEHESDEDIPLPDNDRAGSKLGSILQRSQTSFDMSETVDEDAPMESTRTSQNYRSDFADSKVYQSTTDNDTKQFLSTEEPELKKLMSDDNSEVSEPSPRYVPNFSSESKPSVRSSLKFPVVNPVASENSPIPATRKSTIKSEGKLTPRNSENVSSPASSRVHTPRVKRYVPKPRESIHTESVSSYLPSDADAAVSLTSSANYSDDFQLSASFGSGSDLASSPEVQNVPHRIPSTKLGYTIS
ncbi:microtubule-associated protein 10 [Patella vulgata]|uniref:microtubule-associated protein 10 n=1 Tax=Patella vulgata TaxID=6465 RepID=UPI00217F9FD9|nr:microtubule-associated protein 10 [Patella vulgata]